MPKNLTTLAVEALEARLAERFDRIETMFLATASGLPAFDDEAERMAGLESGFTAEVEAAAEARKGKPAKGA